MYDQVKPFVAVGVGIDPTAADDVSGVSAPTLPMSNISQIFDAKYFLAEGLATYEGDGIPTSINAGMIAPPENALDELNTSIWSKGISDENGSISFSVSISLSRAHTSALTLYFDAHEVTGIATFKNGNTTVESVPFTTSGYRFQESTIRTFDNLILSISHIDAPYRHVRLVEVEFGASRTFGEDEITGNISLIRQIDPYLTSIPVDELDFELINIEGDYDIDNPDTRIGEIALGTPVYLSFSIVEDGVQTTVRQGGYYICAHDGGENSLKVTAQDSRAILQDLYPAMTLSTSRPISESISDVFTTCGIPHIIDEVVMGITPDINYTFDDTYSLLDILLYILQKWDIYCMPDMDGMMHITSYTQTIPINPPITSDYLMDYPYISKNTSYNYVRVKYDKGHYDRDLRDSLQKPMLILNVNNPLIINESEAQALADRIAGYVLANAEQIELSAIGIPSLDLRGNTAIEGRWTTKDYAITNIETTFNGGLDMIVRGGRA